MTCDNLQRVVSGGWIVAATTQRSDIGTLYSFKISLQLAPSSLRHTFCNYIQFLQALLYQSTQTHHRKHD